MGKYGFFNRKNKAMPVSLAYDDYSYQAKMLYMALRIRHSDGTECESIGALGAECGFIWQETWAAVQELERGGFVSYRHTRVPIAVYSNGNAILGNSTVVRLLEDVPAIQERLPAAAWAELRNQIFERDDYTCQYCDERGGTLEVDHVEPISRGGTNEPGNLVTACRSCNRKKRSKLIDEWRGQP